MVQSPRWVDMAVVIIVAVLVGVILVLLMSLTRPRRRFPDHHISKNHIRAIETAVRMYHRDFGAFPPDSTDMSSYGFVSSSPEALVYF
ncbi:MAG: hypothetical protein FJ279_08225, partial [Planctomycetes bacterium]|nr:hypothetical protein [Planctomycetota bacterium]